MEIQYNPLKKYPKPKNQPIKKKHLLFNLNFFPAFKRYKRTGNVKKFRNKNKTTDVLSFPYFDSMNLKKKLIRKFI